MLGNDTDVEGDALTALLVSGPVANGVPTGVLNFSPDGSFTYQPPLDFFGPVTFTYKANDGKLDSNVATVTINVGAVNDAPVAAGIETTALSYTEGSGPVPITSTLTVSDVDDTHLEGAVIEITGNYTSPEDVLGFTDTATIKKNVAASTAGKLVLAGHDTLANYVAALRSVTYTNTSTNPSIASRTVSFLVNDGDVDSAARTRSITIIPVNVAPVANPDTYGTQAAPAINEDEVLQVSGQGVLLNDTDADPDDNRWVASFDAFSANGAAVSFNLDPAASGKFQGTFSYDPTQAPLIQKLGTNAKLADTFTYRVTDGLLTSGPTTVTIWVQGINDKPVAVNDAYQVDEDGKLIVSDAEGLRKNDSDAEGTALGVTLVSGPTNGKLESLTSTGAFTYTPNKDFFGTDTFVYQVSDGELSAQATVTITVNGKPDAPVGVADEFDVLQQNAQLTVVLAGNVLTNDIDRDNEALTAELIAGTGPQHGTLTFNPNGSFTYKPALGFVGVDSFQYRAKDPTNISTAPVTVTINVETGYPWHNPAPGLANDVDNDGFISAIDVLLLSNAINNKSFPGGVLPVPRPENARYFYDVNADGFLTTADVLLVRDYLNSKSVQTRPPDRAARGKSRASRRRRIGSPSSCCRPTAVCLTSRSQRCGPRPPRPSSPRDRMNSPPRMPDRRPAGRRPPRRRRGRTMTTWLTSWHAASRRSRATTWTRPWQTSLESEARHAAEHEDREERNHCKSYPMRRFGGRPQ